MRRIKLGKGASDNELVELVDSILSLLDEKSESIAINALISSLVTVASQVHANPITVVNALSEAFIETLNEMTELNAKSRFN